MAEENGTQEGGEEASAAFAVGDKVEVRSTAAPGLPPVWYAATVVRQLPRVNRYSVEYGSLSVPLPVASPGGNSAKKKQQQPQGPRQTVDLSDMRPVPPTPRGPPPASRPLSRSPGKKQRCSAGFRVGDAVEAYHRDGWWAGCVAGEAGAADATGRKYKVKLFGCTWEDEELEFLSHDLRVRLDWSDGQWVIPPPQHENSPTVGANPEPGFFKEGQLVEVCSDDDGFTGAWFLAVLVKRTGTSAAAGTFLIEYCDLREDDGQDVLREEMDASNIRPLPPRTTTTDETADARAAGDFKVLDEVDAWSNDGWWVGVVSKVLPGPRYAVYFRQSEEELEFPSHELRPHWEWINGDWFRVVLDSGI